MTADIPQRLARLQTALAGGRFEELAAAFNQCADISPRPVLVWLAKAELRRQEGRLSDAEEAARQGVRVNSYLSEPLLTPKVEWRSLVDALILQRESELLAWRPVVRFHARIAVSAGILNEDALSPLLNLVTEPTTLRRLGPAQTALLLDFLGFSRDVREEWCATVLNSFARQLLQSAMRIGNFDVAFLVEEGIYSEHVKRRDASAWFRQCILSWVPAMVSSVPPQHLRPWIPYEWRPESVRKIAFFVHSASLLAHVLVLLETLAACHRIGGRNYIFTVFVMARENEEMAEMFGRAGVRVVFLQRQVVGGYLARMRHLAQVLSEENYAVCVWVSLVTFMGMAFPCRIAPVQIWWSMKYHYCPIPDIDEHFAVESVVRFKQMEGLLWRTIGSASANWFAGEKSEQAGQLRAKFSNSAVVCGSFGREEKLADPQFLKTICELLRRHPEMVFLWTGKTQPPEIARAFADAGLLNQTHFIGWVDTKLYAQVIDIFLDSFPFPCGFTLKEAMAAGKAAVMMRTVESIETGVPGAFDAILGNLNGDDSQLSDQFKEMFTLERPLDLLMCANDVAEYSQMAERLLGSASLREACGSANRKFIESFLSDPDAEGRKFLDHLDEIFRSSPRLGGGLAR